MIPPGARRICIFGGPGSGKSTLAAALGNKLGLPVVHLDTLFWSPGWVESLPEVMDARVKAAAAGDAWVMDGNYTKRGLDDRLGRAQLILVLDMGRLTRMGGILRRTLRYRGQSRPDLGEGCPERLDWAFIRFAWAWPTRGLASFYREQAGPRGTPVIVLKGRRQVNRFLKGL